MNDGTVVYFDRTIGTLPLSHCDRMPSDRITPVHTHRIKARSNAVQWNIHPGTAPIVPVQHHASLAIEHTDADRHRIATLLHPET